MKPFVKIIILIALIPPVICFAQDPGLPDSLIIDSVFEAYAPGQYLTRSVRVYFVADDTIDNLGIFGLTWDSPDGQIYPSDCVWRYPFIDWDLISDTVDFDNHIIRITAFSDIGGDENPFLYTSGQRLWGFNIHFIFSPDAETQTVWIDSAQAIGFNSTQGSFIPQFVRGYIRYGPLIDSVQEGDVYPLYFALSPNYPNPFNAQTIINFDLTKQSSVKLEIFDITGALVATLINQTMPAGRHKAIWDAAVYHSGVYFCRLSTEDKSQTQKMILIK